MMKLTHLIGAFISMIAGLNWFWWGVDHLKPNLLSANIVMIPTILFAILAGYLVTKGWDER